MKDNHLEDGLIQDYCVNAEALPSAAQKHLQNCVQCQEVVSAYRELFVSIGRMESPQISNEFADNVMRTLAARQTVTIYSRVEVPQWVWVGMLVAGAGAVSALVIGQSSLQNILVQFTELWSQSTLGLQISVSKYLTAMNLKPATVVMTVLAMGGIVLMDRVLVRVRRARRLFSLMA